MSIPPHQSYFRTPNRRRPDFPLFVFLPGMDGTGQLLRVQTEGLEKVFDVRCLAIPPDDLTDWHELADQVVHLIELELQDKPQRAVYLCGESFGGCLALQVMLRSPHLFTHLVLVNPASSFNRYPWIYWGTQVSQWMPQSMYQFSSVALLPFLASLDRIEAADRRALLDAVQSVSQETSLWRISMLQKFTVNNAELATIKQPVLVVASMGDRLLPSIAEAKRLIRSMPNAQMHVLPYSGHACLLEGDVNLYQIIKDANFLDEPLVALA